MEWTDLLESVTQTADTAVDVSDSYRKITGQDGTTQAVPGPVPAPASTPTPAIQEPGAIEWIKSNPVALAVLAVAGLGVGFLVLKKLLK